MPPSANRRPGQSRRAQYTTFFGYLAGMLGALLGAGVLVMSLMNPQAFSGVRGLAADTAGPGGRAIASTRDAGGGVIAAVSGYFRAGSQNARLNRELRIAKVRLAESQAIAAENRRLKSLLGIAQSNADRVAVTRIVGSTASSTRRFATLGAGSDSGVMVGMPVRSESGLVGRVLEVSRSTARVLLVTDSENVVPARRARDGLPAFVQGLGDGSVKIRLINLGVNPLRKGDSFVTSGSGGLYRPGTAIAVVTRVTPDGAIARVLSDPATIEYAMVERSWTPPETVDPATPPVAELTGSIDAQAANARTAP